MTDQQKARLAISAAGVSALTEVLKRLIESLPESSHSRERLIVANEHLARCEYELIATIETSQEISEFVSALEPFMEPTLESEIV